MLESTEKGGVRNSIQHKIHNIYTRIFHFIVILRIHIRRIRKSFTFPCFKITHKSILSLQHKTNMPFHILKMVMWNCLMLISLRFVVVVCTVMKCKHRISFVCMVGNISIFIDDYFRMVLHLFSENHFYTIFQYLLQTRHSLKFTCNRNHLLQFFQSNKIHFNHLPAFRQQVSLL